MGELERVAVGLDADRRSQRRSIWAMAQVAASRTTGAIVEHALFGLQYVSGAIYAAWYQAGALEGTYGAPTSEAMAGAEPGSATQRFERGVLAWSPTRGPS